MASEYCFSIESAEGIPYAGSFGGPFRIWNPENGHRLLRFIAPYEIQRQAIISVGSSVPVVSRWL